MPREASPSSDYLGDALRGWADIILDIGLPQSYHNPAVSLKTGGYLAVPLYATRELLTPVRPRLPRKMAEPPAEGECVTLDQQPAMPIVAVYEDGHPRTDEGDVGPAGQTLAVLAIP